MARRGKAKRAASRKSKQVYRSNIRKPKRAVVKKFANFVGKVTYKRVQKTRGRRKSRRRRH